MSRHRRDPDDDFDDDELPDGVYYEDDPPTVPCPYCREPLFEGAQYCPRCENHVSKEDAPADRKPLWIWVCLLLALAASLVAAFM